MSNVLATLPQSVGDVFFFDIHVEEIRQQNHIFARRGFQQIHAVGHGYAKEMSDDYKREQAELVANHVKGQDIVITTALIPGRPAPKLISAEMVRSMKPGSIIYDMAVERGGNCELAKPGEIVNENGVLVLGPLNIAGALAGNATSLYAKNLYNFLALFVSKDDGLKIDFEDEIIQGTLVTNDGKIVHPQLTEGTS